MFARKKNQIPLDGTFTLFDSLSNVLVHISLRENDIFNIETYNDIKVIKNEIDNIVNVNMLQWITGLLFPKCKRTFHFLANDIVIGSCSINHIKNKISFQQKNTYYWLQDYMPSSIDRSYRSNTSEEQNHISELLKCFCIDEDKVYKNTENNKQSLNTSYELIRYNSI